MNEERVKTSKFWKQAKEKKTKPERRKRQKLYWKVRDMRLIKWMTEKKRVE